MNLKLKPSGVFDGVEVYPIPDWEGKYSISKCGRVWSHSREIPAGKGWRTTKGRWRSAFKTPNGYQAIVVSKNSKKSLMLIHRALYTTFLNPSRLIEVEEVDHIDGDRSNNDLSNLRRCSRKQNSRNRKKGSNNSSGFKGVSFCSQTKKWAATIAARIRQGARLRNHQANPETLPLTFV